MARADESFSSLDGGRLAVGAGTTLEYHFDGTTRAPVAELSWTWDRDQFELSAYRFLSSQINKIGYPLDRPNWIGELSRRFGVFRSNGNDIFVGLGGAYKSETDRLNGTRLNFAEQLGWRFANTAGPGFEVVIRHVSNAGIKTPNKGEDFIIAAIVF